MTLSSASEKQQRQQALIRLIRQKNVDCQEVLVDEIKHQGFACTQTTISRDLLELKVMKVGGFYRVSGLSEVRTLDRMLLEQGESVALSGDNLVVLRGQVGTASAFGVEIDREQIPGIVGTLAGDDTVFIAVRTAKDQASIYRRLARALHKKQRTKS